MYFKFSSESSGCFNPRARGGRDATLENLCYIPHKGFNPRARGGRDTLWRRLKFPKEFQSTRPRGARQSFFLSLYAASSFNPRARGGRDDAIKTLVEAMNGFNPRARGGRDILL